MMSKNFIVSVFSKDRVGIISDVTNALLEVGGDLGDLNQAVLNGFFTMILIAEFEKNIDSAAVESAVNSKFDDDSNVNIIVRELPDTFNLKDNKSFNSDDDRYVLTASSENRRGLVAEVAKFCKDNQINITFLSTRISDDKYVMMFLVDLSSVEYLDVLREKLRDFALESKLEIVLQHNDIFKATNEIKYYK